MPQEIEGISTADWEATPNSVKVWVGELLKRFECLNEQYKTLNQEVSPLSEQMHQLEQQVDSSSQRSKPRLVKGFEVASNRRRKRR